MTSKARLFSILALLILPLVLGAIFSPVIFGGKTLLPTDQLNTMMLPFSEKHDSVKVFNHFLTDAIAQVYPYKVRWRENALRGEFFSWNPMILGGHPQYASTSFTHFDPTNIILLLGEMPAAYHAQMLIKLLIGGVGMWILLGSLTVQGLKIHVLVRTLFALAFMLNSLFVTTLQHQWLVGAMIWLPWALVFGVKLILSLHYRQSESLQKHTLRYTVLTAFFLALSCYSGSLQTSAIAILGFSIVALMLTLQNRTQSARERIITAFVILGGIGLLAFALSAAMWLPSLELFLYNENIRAAGKSFSLVNSLKSLPLLVSFIVPELIGTPRGFDLAKIAQADMNDFNAYFGFAPWLFGLIGCVVFWNNGTKHLSPEANTQRHAEQVILRSFIVLSVLGLLVPLATPLYKFVYHRSFILYVLGMCVVGAITMQRVFFGETPSDKQKQIRAFLWGLAVLLAVILVGLVIGNIVLAWKYEVIASKFRAFVENNLQNAQLAAGSRAWMMGRVEVFLTHFSWKNPLLYVALFTPLLALWLIWRYWREPSKQVLERVVVGLIAVTIVQLWSGVASWSPMIDTERYPLYPPTQTTDFLCRDTTLFRILPIFDNASHRVMQPNINEMYGIACVQGYESIFARNVSLLAGTLGQPVETQQIRMGAAANVKYYVASGKNPLVHPALQLVDSGATLVYRNLLAEERAYMRYRYRVVAGQEPQRFVKLPHRERFEQVLMNDSIFFTQEVLLNDEPYEKIHRHEDSIPHKIKFLAYQNNHVVVEVESAESGYFVLADSYYAGWKAFVNGQERPILNANYVLRAVVVPKGKSRVEFHFEPSIVRVGAWISFGACILCFALLILPILGNNVKHKTMN